jgi:hypothetical protein
VPPELIALGSRSLWLSNTDSLWPFNIRSGADGDLWQLPLEALAID